MRKLILIAALLLCTRCTDAWHRSAIRTSDAAALLANSGGEMLVSRACQDTMAAMGRGWALNASTGRCEATGPRKGTLATVEEQTALHAAENRWRKIRDAQETLAAVHDALRAAITADDPAKVLAMLSQLAAAYGALRALALDVNVTLPPMVVSP